MSAIRALAGALAALAVVTGLAAGFAWAAATVRQRERQDRPAGQPAHLSQWERRP